MEPLHLLVEGDKDAEYVDALLKSAELSDNVIVMPTGGLSVLREVSKDNDLREKVAFLIDSDLLSIKEAREEFAEIGNFPIERIFVAVPELESWVFSDTKNLMNYIKNSKKNLRALQRITISDEMFYPRQVLHYMAGGLISSKVFSTIDLSTACSHSPSLSDFLNGISKITNSDKRFENHYSNNFNLDIIANLLREVSPIDKVVYRSLSGESYSAIEMSRQVSSETSLGKQYAADLLRISRDLLSRQSRKND